MADAFALAREIRQLDLRAGPHDFRALGLEAVPVETPEGRAAHAAEQRLRPPGRAPAVAAARRAGAGRRRRA